MVEVGGVLVEKDILTKYFCCDITRCFGGCCTFPGIYGAPLSDAEVPILESQVEIVKGLLSDVSLSWIAQHGVAEYTSGRPTTVCINKRDCVFVYYDDKEPVATGSSIFAKKKSTADVALCSIEKEYFGGKTTFRKPISCWLFPIRVAFHENTMYLYYEQISECKDAIKNGKAKKIKIYEALNEPLIAFLGQKWYDTLVQVAADLVK
ncbi:MAG: DUF3109 family protein [Ignavibacteria bacterium]|jgi:hypothetical protein|nr:DUF3109 family protein [Ignavibacteria bacterium]